MPRQRFSTIIKSASTNIIPSHLLSEEEEEEEEEEEDVLMTCLIEGDNDDEDDDVVDRYVCMYVYPFISSSRHDAAST